MPTTEVPNSPSPPQLDGGPDGEQPKPSSGGQLRLNTSDAGIAGIPETDGLVQRISELEDERRAARIREGIWVALLLHAALMLLWAFGPRYLFHQPRIVSPADALKDRKDLTYLDLPPDALKQLKPKNPAALSDKNRQQSTAHPTLDKKTLEQLQAMKRAGPPAPQQQAEQSPTPQQAAPQQPPAPQQQVQQSPPPSANPTPSLALPREQAQTSQQQTNPFKTPSSAGEMIRQAAKGATNGSPGGDFGANAPVMHGGMNAGAEILSDTLGVDFGPYMKRVIAATYSAWLPIIPESAQPPLDNKGKVFIDFIIAPDGSVKKMILRGPSGDVALDRAAWGGIIGASYPPLPKEFKGPYLALRFGFFYNIKPEDER